MEVCAMHYNDYKKARNAAWQILIDHKVSELPVRISSICQADGITIRSYKNAQRVISEAGFLSSMESNDGFAVRLKGRDYIFYNDCCSIQRQRFTVAHEYGHFINDDVSEIPTHRNREPQDNDDPMETAANVIASRILAPSCVLWGMKIHKAEDIAKICDISITSATWKMKRMELLYQREKEFLLKWGRSCFLQSQLEMQVYDQFLSFINKFIN